MRIAYHILAVLVLWLVSVGTCAQNSGQPPVSPRLEKIYWSALSGPKIRRSSPDGSDVESVIDGFGAGGIAVDLLNGKIYWADGSWLDIRRANLDGTSVEIVVPNGTVSNPRQISLDVARGKIYWTDEFHPIRRANLDGTEIEDLIATNSSPSELELHLERGKIYWVDGYGDNIRRANLDGSNVEDLVTDIYAHVSGLSLDRAQGKMYWTDLNLDRISRANLDGSGVEDIFTVLPDGLFNPEAIAVDRDGEAMFWAATGFFPDREWRILRSDLNGVSTEVIFVSEFGDEVFTDIAFVEFEPDKDTDRDGLPDGYELANGFDPTNADEDSNGVVDGQDDSDVDGLGNAAEAMAGTDPRDGDTDGDGIADGGEIGTGTFGAQDVITSTADGANVVIAADIDGDGDADVLSCAFSGGELAWYENLDGNGAFGAPRVITTLVSQPVSIVAADMDRDGDLDVLSASNLDNKIAWYENTDGAGSFGDQRVISTQAEWPLSVAVTDVDGDHDLDVLSASYDDGQIAWFENTDGNGSFGGIQTIGTFAGPTVVHPVDVDGDGDVDVVAGFSPTTTPPGLNDRILWFENTDGAGAFGGAQQVTASVNWVFDVRSADVDGDGDVDLLSASRRDNKVAWYENIDGDGSFGAQSLITTSVDEPRSLNPVDLDGDGDIDVVSASQLDRKIAWYQRDQQNSNGFGPQLIITTLTDQPGSVYSADIDGDGDLDVLSASLADDTIAWYEQLNVSDPLDSDSDDDGLGDGVEVNSVGSDPQDSDSDDDGLSDGEEVNAVGSDPLDSDTDDDGVVDGQDAFPVDPTEQLDSDLDGVGDNADAFPQDGSETKDSDGDGVGDNADDFPNDASEQVDTDQDGIGNNADDDDDGDGLSDGEEATLGTDRLSADSDSDGLTDSEEIDLGTDPLDADTDGDSMSDGYEVKEGFNPKDGSDCPSYLCGGISPGLKVFLIERARATSP